MQTQQASSPTPLAAATKEVVIYDHFPNFCLYCRQDIVAENEKALHAPCGGQFCNQDHLQKGEQFHPCFSVTEYNKEKFLKKGMHNAPTIKYKGNEYFALPLCSASYIPQCPTLVSVQQISDFWQEVEEPKKVKQIYGYYLALIKKDSLIITLATLSKMDKSETEKALDTFARVSQSSPEK